MQDTRPSDQCAYSVKAQSPYEDSSVAIMSKNPIRMTERSKWICAKISCLKARGPSSSNVEGVLEMFVQGIEKTIRKPLFSTLANHKEGTDQNSPKERTEWSRDIAGISIASASIPQRLSSRHR
jgi:hypothetical protein